MSLIYPHPVGLLLSERHDYHPDHLALVRQALTVCEHVVMGLTGAWRSRNLNYALTVEERQRLVQASLTAAERARVTFLPLVDRYNDAAWGHRIHTQLTARGFPNAALMGYEADDLFERAARHVPHLKVLPAFARHTDPMPLRMAHTLYFAPMARKDRFAVLAQYLARPAQLLMDQWMSQGWYRDLEAEYETIVKYRNKYTATVYTTADAIVTCQNHVLLIRRSGDVGYGLLAAPGGFVDAGEDPFDAASRELAEETGLRFSREEARALAVRQAVFNHPLRSPRCQLETTAVHFDLGNRPLPKVEGLDDAKGGAFWVPDTDLLSYVDQCFEDHAALLDDFLDIY